MQGGYEPQSDICKGWLAQGKAEGLQEGLAQGKAEGRFEGRAEGKAEGLLAVLAARKLPVADAERAAILACRDQAQLDRWIARAVTADSVAEVLG